MAKQGEKKTVAMRNLPILPLIPPSPCCGALQVNHSAEFKCCNYGNNRRNFSTKTVALTRLKVALRNHTHTHSSSSSCNNSNSNCNNCCCLIMRHSSLSVLHRLLTSFLAMAVELFKLRQVDFAKELNTLVEPDAFLSEKLFAYNIIE